MVARIWNSYLQNKPIFTIMTKVQYALQLKLLFQEIQNGKHGEDISCETA